MEQNAKLDWQRARRVFEEALLRPPEERRDYARKLCGGDESVWAEVTSLLDSHESSDDAFLENPAVVHVVQDTQTDENQLAAGQRLLHYEIRDLIGAGGMGEVYLARDTRLGRNVAVKLLRRDLLPHFRAGERLLREARASAVFEHPNICQIHEISEVDGFSFIVMQYVVGTTLDEILSGRGVDTAAALDIAAQVAEGLAEAHRQGIVHRDIKPANIIVSDKGHVKILDFGLAKFLEVESSADAASRMESTGGVMGTVPYMSPEQLLGAEVDARTDVFSFGAMLFEMLCGVSAFGRKSNEETISAILNAEPDWSLLPLPLQPLLQRCLTKDPSDRFASAREVVEVLSAARKSVKVSNLKRSRTTGRQRPDAATAPAEVLTQQLYAWQGLEDELPQPSPGSDVRRQSFLGIPWLAPAAMAGAFLIPLVIGLAFGTRAQGDTFDGTALDADKWEVSSGMVGGSVTQNDALYLTTDGFEPANWHSMPRHVAGGVGVALRRKIAGDFDIQVDFRDFNGGYGEATQAIFQVYQDDSAPGNSGNWLHFKRIRGYMGDAFQTLASVNGVFPLGTGSPNATTSGTFRIVRVGTRISTYFNGIDDFSFEAFDGPVIVTMAITGPGQSGSVVFDNFRINSGTLVEPSLSNVTPASDTFDGTVVDIDKWEVSSGLVGGSVTQNDALYLTTDGSEPARWCFTPGHFGPGVGVALRRKIAGDFDIQVDFRDFSGGSETAKQAYLQVYQDATRASFGNQLHIKRLRQPNQDIVRTAVSVNGTFFFQTGSSNTATSGAFRIVRVGNRISTYFNDTEDFSHEAFSGPVIVTMEIGGDGQPASVVFDNFHINSGTLVEPPLSCEERAETRPPNCAELPPNLVSWWPADSDARDINNRNNGTIVGPVTFAAGKVGQAFNFDGTTGYIAIGDALDVNLGNMTVEAWIKADPSMQKSGRIADKGCLNGWCLGRIGSTNRVGFEFLGSASHLELSTTSGVIDNSWHHVAVVVQNRMATIYVDGIAEDEGKVKTVSQNNNLPLWIGGGPGEGTAGNWKGMIDELSFFDRALSPAEVLSIANAGAAGKCRTSRTPTTRTTPTIPRRHLDY